MGAGGLGLQDHLSQAAEGLTEGDSEAGDAEYRLVHKSTELLQRSTDGSQVDLLERSSLTAVTVANWRYLTESA